MSRSTYLKYKPHLLKAKLLAGATDSITGKAGKVGLGGIDFGSAQWSGYYVSYTGNNSAFDYYAKYDGGSSSYYIEKRIYISSYWAKARAVMLSVARLIIQEMWLGSLGLFPPIRKSIAVGDRFYHSSVIFTVGGVTIGLAGLPIILR